MDWSNNLYNGLVINRGKPAKLAARNTNKPLYNKQLSEITEPDREMMTDNSRYRGLTKNDKKKIGSHRRFNFLEQEF